MVSLLRFFCFLLVIFLSFSLWAEKTVGLSIDQYRQASDEAEKLWRKEPEFMANIIKARQSVLYLNCAHLSDKKSAEKFFKKANDLIPRISVGWRVYSEDQDSKNHPIFEKFPEYWKQVFRTFSLEQESFIFQFISKEVEASLESRFLLGRNQKDIGYIRRQLLEIYRCSEVQT